MGSFANTVFSIMLGWVQGIVSMVWNALTSKGGNNLLQFIGNNWIKIAIVLCALGLITDLCVYMFRWQPYKVWNTFWRKLHSRKTESEEGTAGDPAAPHRPARYFKPVVEADDEPEAPAAAYTRTGEMPEEEPAAAAEVPDDLYRWREAETEDTRPVVPAETTKAGYVVPADSPYRRPEDRAVRQRNRRRRMRMTLLGDSGDEDEFHYNAPQPIVDQRKAYYAPVYPENWGGGKKGGEQDS